MVDLKSLLETSERKTNLKRIFTTEDEKVKVSWKELHNQSSIGNTRLVEEAHNIMIELGILSIQPTNNYVLIGTGVVLNPGDGLRGTYYFTQEKDAKSFKEVGYSNAQYSVNLFKGE